MTLQGLSVLGLAWGVFLANHVWQSTWCAVVAAVLALILRGNYARARYGVWLAASLKFLVPFSWLVSLGSVFGMASAVPASAPPLAVAIGTIGQPFSATPAVVAPATASAVSTGFIDLVPALLLGLWVVGCGAVVFSWCLRWRRLAAVARAASPLRTGREADSLDRLRRTGVFTRRIGLASSNSSLEPGVFGIARPRLLLPAGIADRLGDGQLDAILAHELCHVRRRDNLAAALHGIVEALFWFHPLVWWLGARLVDERERACDQEVIRLGSDPHVYAESLLNVCEFYVESPLECVAGVTGSNLKKRIEAIMNADAGIALTVSKRVLLATVAVVAIAAPVAIGVLTSPGLLAQSPAAAGVPRAWQSVRTNHLEILYTPELGNHVDRVGRDAERAYQRVSADLKHDLAFVPMLILFGTQADRERSVADGVVTQVAQLRPDVHAHVLMSVDMPDVRFAADLIHELTHTFTFDILPEPLRQSVPVWVIEGLAEYERGEWDASAVALLGNVVRTNAILRISSLTGVPVPQNRGLHQTLGHAAFDFIESRWGKNGVRQFLFSLRKHGTGTPQSVYQGAFGLTPDQFDQGFSEYLKGRFPTRP